MMKDDDNSRWILLYSWLRSCFTFMEKGDNKHDEVLGEQAVVKKREEKSKKRNEPLFLMSR